jgi:hypothetical protein
MKRMMSTQLKPLGVTLLAMVLGGCASTARVKPIVPDQQMLVTLPELTGQPFDVPAGTYRVLGDPRTRGRFPCSIAVAKVRYRDETAPIPESGLALQPLQVDNAVRWVGLFDNLPEVVEVFQVDYMGLPAAPVTTVDVYQAAGRVGAGLCIVMSEGVSGAQDGFQVVGSLYDPAAGTPIVVVRSSVFPVLTGEEDPNTIDIPGYHVPGTDQADVAEAPEHDRKVKAVIPPYDPLRLAQAHFRELVRRAVWEMVRQDQVPTATEPSPWSDWRQRRRMLLWPPPQ